MSFDDVELGGRLLAGDQSALVEIYVRFGPGLLGRLARKFARRLPPGEVKDVLQEALFILWDRRRGFDPRKGSLRGWYSGIAKKIALKRTKRGWVKARQRRKKCEGEDLDELAWVAREVDAGRDGAGDGEADHRSRRQRFRQENLPVMGELLAALRCCERAALLATGNGDHPISRAEAAEQLGEKPNTFRSHLKRAHDRINAECARRGLPPPDWTAWEPNSM